MILVLISWIPVSKNFILWKIPKLCFAFPIYCLKKISSNQIFTWSSSGFPTNHTSLHTVQKCQDFLWFRIYVKSIRGPKIDMHLLGFLILLIWQWSAFKKCKYSLKIIIQSLGSKYYEMAKFLKLISRKNVSDRKFMKFPHCATRYLCTWIKYGHMIYRFSSSVYFLQADSYDDLITDCTILVVLCRKKIVHSTELIVIVL